MNEDEIAGLVARLDQLVPRAGASVIINQNFDEHIVVGNWNGHMRLGIELLKATTAAGPPGPEGRRLEPAINDFVEKNGELEFDLVDNPSFLTTSPTERRTDIWRWVAVPLLIGLAWVFIC